MGVGTISLVSSTACHSASTQNFQDSITVFAQPASRIASISTPILSSDDTQERKLAYNELQQLLAGIAQSPSEKKRRRVSYTSNVTPSRSVQEGHAHCKPANKTPIKNEVELRGPCQSVFADVIKDHAYRRIQILYYIFVAYYNEGCSVVADRTSHQHGSSACLFCCGAHSNLLPNLKDDFFSRMFSAIFDQGFTPEMEVKLQCFGVPQHKIEALRGDLVEVAAIRSVIEDISELGRTRLISPETYFYQVMNSTVELPVSVNVCDGLIENEMRPRVLTLLNEVSAGTLSPYEALQQVVAAMQLHINRCERAAAQKIDVLRQIHEIYQAIHQLENSLPTDGEWVRWLTKYQGWINRLYVQKQRWNALKSHTGLRRLNLTLSCRVELFNLIHEKDFYKLDRITAAQIGVELTGHLQKLHKWTPRLEANAISELEESIAIFQLQHGGTELPLYEHLSGQYIAGRLEPLDEAGLYRQKIELISRIYDNSSPPGSPAERSNERAW